MTSIHRNEKVLYVALILAQAQPGRKIEYVAPVGYYRILRLDT